MRQESNRLKLGKGSAFVKSKLMRLPQRDDTWEVDFFPIPCSESKHECVWMGVVITHASDDVLARRMYTEPPTVNDLATLLANAMQRPMADGIHRPTTLYLRARPEWAELLPHLTQIGIAVVSQEALPRWDRAFGDLQAQVEQALSDQASKQQRRRPVAKAKKPATPAGQQKLPEKEQLYTLEVFLLSGPITEKFAKKNRVISRTIQIRGNQTLEDLHHAIFDAFGRFDEHMYEFQFGKGPMDPKGPRYVLPCNFDSQPGEENPPAGRVDKTTIASLGLKVGDAFGYWFDFGDDWWHQINVEAIEDEVPRGKFPKVTKKVGKSPPQYAEEDE